MKELKGGSWVKASRVDKSLCVHWEKSWIEWNAKGNLGLPINEAKRGLWGADKYDYLYRDHNCNDWPTIPFNGVRSLGLIWSNQRRPGR